MARRTRDEGTEQVPVALPRTESAPESWLRNLRFSGFTLLMLGILVLAVIVLAPNLRILIEQRAQIAELQESVDDAAESVDEHSEFRVHHPPPRYHFQFLKPWTHGQINARSLDFSLVTTEMDLSW